MRERLATLRGVANHQDSLRAELGTGGGVAFELPIFVFFLSIAGIVDARTMLRGTPHAILGIFIAAAILTPPDWVSQVLLGIPMVFLYLLGVGAAWLFGGARRGSASTSALRLPGR